MSKAITTMVRQHRDCDEQLGRCETALRKGDMAAAGRTIALFSAELDHHLALEEERMFPAFEEATGMSGGPTEVMRGEHTQIRALRDEARAAVEAGDADEALAVIDTLNVLISQHNVKEENILYPMCESSVPNLVAVLGFGGDCGGGCACGGGAGAKAA